MGPRAWSRGAQVPRCHRRSRCPRCDPAPQEREALADRHRRCRRAKRDTARLQIPRPGLVATMERIPPSEPRRDEDALCKAAGPAAHGTGLRPPGRRASGPYRRPERLHRARHTRHRARGMSPSGERGTSTFSRSVQQSRLTCALLCFGTFCQVAHSRSTTAKPDLPGCLRANALGC